MFVRPNIVASCLAYLHQSKWIRYLDIKIQIVKDEVLHGEGLQLPPNESLSTDVIVELWYGTVLNTKTNAMSEPKERVCGKNPHNQITMVFIARSSCILVVQCHDYHLKEEQRWIDVFGFFERLPRQLVRLTLSLPAKSTMLSLLSMTVSASDICFSNRIVNMPDLILSIIFLPIILTQQRLLQIRPGRRRTCRTVTRQ